MEWLREFKTVGGLLALRCGLPLLITLLIGRWLSRLDAKWQAEEAARAACAGSMAARVEAPRCWEIKGCDPAMRATCPAHALRPLPCWWAFRRLNGRVPERCYACAVFLQAQPAAS